MALMCSGYPVFEVEQPSRSEGHMKKTVNVEIAGARYNMTADVDEQLPFVRGGLVRLQEGSRKGPGKV